MTEPVVMTRQKDFRPKPTSRYASGSSTGSGSKKRKKTPNKAKATMQRVMVLQGTWNAVSETFEMPMKTRWIWRAV